MWLSLLALIVFYFGHELSGGLAGEEADKSHERIVMRGDTVDGRRFFSACRSCVSSMLIHDLAHAHAVPRRWVTGLI